MRRIARLSAFDRSFVAALYVYLTLTTLSIIYPLIYIVSASFSSIDAVMSGKVVLLPVDFSLAGYRAVFRSTQVAWGYANSVYYTALGTAINIVMTLLAAYPLSRKDLRGRNLLTGVLTFTMFFSGGLIPTYLLIKSLGMLNTRWALLIPGAFGVWYVIVARTYFQSNLPHELLEASQMDGCSDFRFLAKIVVPLSGPMIAVLTLWYAVGHWNSYFDALIYLEDARKYPLQIVLRNILIRNTTDPRMLSKIDAQESAEGLRELLKYALIIVASVPVLLLYPLAQRYFVRGVMVGAIKG